MCLLLLLLLLFALAFVIDVRCSAMLCVLSAGVLDCVFCCYVCVVLLLVFDACLLSGSECEDAD